MRFREILIEIDEEFSEEELDGIIRDVSIQFKHDLNHTNDDFVHNILSRSTRIIRKQ